MGKARYAKAVEIDKNLTMSNETLEFIKKHDPELYKVIMPEDDE